jgi:eukaryotic-like serine/threonine-protein kinase
MSKFEPLSETIINYDHLIQLLADQKWQEADLETCDLLLKMVKREQAGWLRGEDIEKIPDDELKIIDQLWVNASQGHFGFSILSQIYDDCEQDYYQLGEKVGWRKDNCWLEKYNLIYNLTAPQGQFPYFFRALASRIKEPSLASSRWIKLFFDRVKSCLDTDNC